MKTKFLTLTIISLLTTFYPLPSPFSPNSYAQSTTPPSQTITPSPTRENNTVIPLTNLILNILILLLLLILLVDTLVFSFLNFKSGKIGRVYSELFKEINKVRKEIESLGEKLQKLERIERKIGEDYLSRKTTEIQLSISEIKNQIMLLKEAIDLKLEYQRTKGEIKPAEKAQIPREENKNWTPPTPQKEESEYSILLKNYRENPNSLFHNAIPVAMTKETLNNLVTGTWGNVIEFQEDNRRGDYYIVPDNMGKFYLFLNPNGLFNQHNLTLIEKSQVFQFKNTPHGSYKGKDITIIKPALVRQENQYWRLTESGEIEFPPHRD